MPLPVSFLNHLRTVGYHSRSNKHSKAIADAIVTDLVARCSGIATEAAEGRLVFDYDVELRSGRSRWRTDLAIGPPARDLRGREMMGVPLGGMGRATPASTRIAVEAKSVMTKHTGARKNRKRELEAHHQHVHDYDGATIAASITVINAANTFYSPVPPAGLRHHRDPLRLAALVLDEVENITTSTTGSRVGLDAKCALILDMDNVAQPTGSFLVEYVSKSPPAPEPGSPLHWDSFIQRICSTYGSRF